MRPHFTRHLLWLVVVLLLSSSVSFGIPVLAQVGPDVLFLPYLPSGQTQTATEETTGPNEEPVDEESPLPEESYVRLPDYTEEELRAMRGIPLFPEDPDTLYLPPGVATLQDLPVCAGSTVDDPATEINENEAEHQQWLRDGTYERNAKVRVVVCQYIPDPTRGISMTVEEYDRWWEENGRPVIPDPAFDHPDGQFYNQPQSGAVDNTPMATAETYYYSWGQFELMSPSSPDITFGTLRADLVYGAPYLSAGQSWSNYGQFTRIHVGHNSYAHCSGMGLDKMIVGVGMGKWHESTTPTDTPRIVYALNSAAGCVAQGTLFIVNDFEPVAFRIERDPYYTLWYLHAYVDEQWRAVASMNPVWGGNYARRITAGSQIYATNGQKSNVHVHLNRMFHISADIPNLDAKIPWADPSLPSSYRDKTSVCSDFPFLVIDQYAVTTDNYTSMMFFTTN